MTKPTTRTAKTADGRPDAHHGKPTTLPASAARTRDAAGRMAPVRATSLKRDDPRVGDDDTPLHVVPSGNNWGVKVEGEDTHVAISPTKAEACDTARDLAKDRGVRLIVHKTDGTIQRVLDYA